MMPAEPTNIMGIIQYLTEDFQRQHKLGRDQITIRSATVKGQEIFWVEKLPQVEPRLLFEAAAFGAFLTSWGVECPGPDDRPDHKWLLFVRAAEYAHYAARTMMKWKAAHDDNGNKIPEPDDSDDTEENTDD
jgi:hypothetical protein